MNRMRSTDRGFNWYAAVYGVRETFAERYVSPLSAVLIRWYVQMDQQGPIG